MEDEDRTDLVVRIRDGRISMSDGLMSDDDQNNGYNTANLPTGKVSMPAQSQVRETFSVR